jgi:hypothetical protein
MVNIEMGNLFTATIFGVPWIALAAGALIVAIAYVFIDTSLGSSGPRWVVLRWFHPLCWVLLSAAALAKARLTPLPEDWAAPIAALGGVAYLVFAALWVMTPKA